MPVGSATRSGAGSPPSCCSSELALLERVRQMAVDLPAAMSHAAGEPSVSDLGSPLPARLTDLVAARCQVLLRHLG